MIPIGFFWRRSLEEIDTSLLYQSNMDGGTTPCAKSCRICHLRFFRFLSEGMTNLFGPPTLCCFWKKNKNRSNLRGFIKIRLYEQITDDVLPFQLLRRGTTCVLEHAIWEIYVTSLQEPVELSNSVGTVDIETRDHFSLYSLCVDLTSLDVLLQRTLGEINV